VICGNFVDEFSLLRWKGALKWGGRRRADRG
jgi:hypothetical protein